MKYLALLLILLSLFCFHCSSPPSTPNLEEEIRSIENGLIREIVVKNDSIVKFSIEERMAFHQVPGISIAIVRNGNIRWAKGYGIANTETGALVNENTLFQAGSISKPIAALAALKLVQENKVDLDTDVNTYLDDWKIEENEFTQTEKVTLRRLLTHTAGTTVHGFPGYQQTDSFPTINQVLNGEGNTPRVFVDTTPGDIWRYSGGGYTIMEKLVEEITGLPLEDYIQEHILNPMQMNNSTYSQPLSAALHRNASAAYDSDGTIIEGFWHNYPEQAAAGLWTTPSDLAKYCISIQEILSGNNSGILNKESVKQMLTKHKNNWGLGPSLQWEGDSLRFQHGGKNAGFTNNMIAFAYRGDAVIIMTNADNGGHLIGEILRSVSQYYDLGVSNPKVVELIVMKEEDLKKFTGKYLYEKQVPGLGDLYLEVHMENNNLVVHDPDNGQRNELYPQEGLKFIDLEDGDSMTFQQNGDSISFKWNNRFLFNKVE